MSNEARLAEIERELDAIRLRQLALWRERRTLKKHPVEQTVKQPKRDRTAVMQDVLSLHLQGKNGVQIKAEVGAERSYWLPKAIRYFARKERADHPLHAAAVHLNRRMYE